LWEEIENEYSESIFTLGTVVRGLADVVQCRQEMEDQERMKQEADFPGGVE